MPPLSVLNAKRQSISSNKSAGKGFSRPTHLTHASRFWVFMKSTVYASTICGWSAYTMITGLPAPNPTHLFQAACSARQIYRTQAHSVSLRLQGPLHSVCWKPRRIVFSATRARSMVKTFYPAHCLLLTLLTCRANRQPGKVMTGAASLPAQKNRSSARWEHPANLFTPQQ